MRKRKIKHQKLDDMHMKGTGPEGSAYWGFISNGNPGPAEGMRGEADETAEPADANPDVLPESAGAWSSTEEESFRKAMVRKVLEDDMLELLTPIQRQVFELVVFQGMTQQAAADQLGIKQATVWEHLDVGGRFLRAILQGADPIKRPKR